MIADLLRLASIGQNMELYGGNLQVRQSHLNGHVQLSPARHRAQHRQSHNHHNHHHHNSDQQNFHGGKHEAAGVVQRAGQCKPLDLSVKRLTSAHSFSQLTSNKATRVARQPKPLSISATGRLSPLDLEMRKQVAVGNGKMQRGNANKSQHLKRSQLQQQFTHHTTKLISSSTSPSSCSRSVSASSNESKSCNDLMISSTNNNNNNINHILNSGSPTSDKLATQQAAASTTLNATTTAASTTTTSSSSTNKRQKHKNLKSHLCHQCGRSFSRSDMLTRHSRLHSGLKPYQCGKCKQVFSRSDHLSTHERTHTGEKPYQCERCAYSACRRDMITRHMRTHSANGSTGTTSHLMMRASGNQFEMTTSLADINNPSEQDEPDCNRLRLQVKRAVDRRKASTITRMMEEGDISSSLDEDQFEQLQQFRAGQLER